MEKALPRIMAVAFGVSLVICFVDASPTLNTTLKNINCSGDTYSGGDYAACVDYVIEAMTTVTANSPFFYYNIRCPFPVTPVAYGLSICKPLTEIADCVTCLSTAKSLIKEMCSNATSVKMILEDCYMSYGPNPITPSLGGIPPPI